MHGKLSILSIDVYDMGSKAMQRTYLLPLGTQDIQATTRRKRSEHVVMPEAIVRVPHLVGVLIGQTGHCCSYRKDLESDDDGKSC